MSNEYKDNVFAINDGPRRAVFSLSKDLDGKVSCVHVESYTIQMVHGKEQLKKTDGVYLTPAQMLLFCKWAQDKAPTITPEIDVHWSKRG